jgi:magnesium chelatase family protein
VIASVLTCLLRGLEAVLVEVQADIAPGSPAFSVVGLADTRVKEARERVRAAIRNSDLTFPSGSRLTVNLAPADLPKDGVAFDLPIAVAIALAQLGRGSAPGTAFLGQLGLDGGVRHADGMLVAAQALRAAGVARVFVPAEDAAEAALVEGLEVFPTPTLAAAMRHLCGDDSLSVHPHVSPVPPAHTTPADDLAEVHGQLAARRALEVCAAGGHHLLLSGPPGAGKTMIARCLPGILPPLDLTEAMDVTRVESIVGALGPEPLRWERPFRSPHHSISTAGLVGGGTGLGRPGEITRAHLGVLFLDELAEFSGSALQALRQPLEQGSVTITRSQGTVVYPARFQLVAATNPCPCGRLGEERPGCRCSPRAIEAYQRTLSGPLLDRIDLRVNVTRPPLAAFAGQPKGEPSAAVRERVIAARRRQLERQGRLNASLRPADLRRNAPLGSSRTVLERWAAERGMSGRGFHRSWRVARTLADLACREAISADDVLEALGYRVELGAAA